MMMSKIHQNTTGKMPVLSGIFSLLKFDFIKNSCKLTP